jgi:F0F1-type ATP synthase membrane subunit c/vacuolar-type H+-ATPase subunit K
MRALAATARLTLPFGALLPPEVSPTKYTLFDGFAHLSSGLSCGLAGLAAGMAIGIVGDAGVRCDAAARRGLTCTGARRASLNTSLAAVAAIAGSGAKRGSKQLAA